MTFLKKLGCLFSAVALFACSCIPVAAVEIDSENESSSKDVTAKYSAGVVVDVYSVEIEWGSMEFEYTDESRVWNPKTHKYEVTETPSWAPAEEDANKVKITNHSNKPVTVALSYTPAESYSGITGSFSVSSQTISSAIADSDYDDAPNFTATLALSGALPSSVSSKTVIGSAKVTLTSGGNSDMNTNNNTTPDNTVPDNSDDQLDIPDEMDTSTPVGSIRLYSNRTEFEEYSFEKIIYKQSESVYMAELFGTEILTKDDGARTEIIISDTNYYIYEAGKGYEFKPGTTVDISTAFYNDGSNKEEAKVTAIEPNKTYLLTIVLNSDGETGTAALTEIDS
jgi:hypothetical protein